MVKIFPLGNYIPYFRNIHVLTVSLTSIDSRDLSEYKLQLAEFLFIHEYP